MVRKVRNEDLATSRGEGPAERTGSRGERRRPAGDHRSWVHRGRRPVESGLRPTPQGQALLRGVHARLAAGRREARAEAGQVAHPRRRAVSFLLDTNVVWELVRPVPAPEVVAWVDSV